VSLLADVLDNVDELDNTRADTATEPPPTTTPSVAATIRATR
jgi:hypothetical protein